MKRKINVVSRFAKEKVSNNDLKGIKWLRREDDESPLYVLIEEDNLSVPLQYWPRKNNRPVTNLKEIARIKTKHSVDDGQGRGEVDYAAPLYGEVLEQLSPTLLDTVVAIEVLIWHKERSQGFDTITTVLYGKK